MSRGKKDLALKFFENAKNNYEIALVKIKLGTNRNPLEELLFDLDETYLTNANLGEIKYELYFSIEIKVKDKLQRNI